MLTSSTEQEFSRQVPTAEASAFAERMNSLFIEASAKMSVNVKETFQEVVEKIIDTPALWTNGTGQSKVRMSFPHEMYPC